MLTDEERETVKASAKQLLSHLHEKLVQDWRRKVDVTKRRQSTIRRVLDEGLPQEPYTPDIFTVQLVFDHVLTAHGDNGESAYDSRIDIQRPMGLDGELAGHLNVNQIADDVVGADPLRPRLRSAGCPTAPVDRWVLAVTSAAGFVSEGLRWPAQVAARRGRQPRRSGRGSTAES